MGQALGYSLGTRGVDTPDGELVASPDQLTVVVTAGDTRPVFTAVPVTPLPPLPAPTAAAAAVATVVALDQSVKPLPRGVQADMALRRALARKIGEDIHTSLF